MLNRGWIVSRDGSSIYHYDRFDPPTGAFTNLSTYTFDRRSRRLIGRSYAARVQYARVSAEAPRSAVWPIVRG
jgi:hypothetical protein